MHSLRDLSGAINNKYKIIYTSIPLVNRRVKRKAVGTRGTALFLRRILESHGSPNFGGKPKLFFRSALVHSKSEEC